MRRLKRRVVLGLAMVASSRPAGAQRPDRVRRIGCLINGGSSGAQPLYDAFRETLRQLGYVEGQSILIEYRSPGSRIERLPELARELVELKVDVIFTTAASGGRAAFEATKVIPIVVAVMGDPVGDGLIASLAHPGGNLTGTTYLGPELVPKRLALLKELVPSTSRVSVLWHPEAFSEQTMKEMQKETADAAGLLGLQLQFTAAHNVDELDRAVAIASSDADAMLQFPSSMLYGERRRIVELAARYRLPTMYNAREFVEVGGLIGYGANIKALVRHSATYVDKILKGAKPSELPVEQPSKFELVVNLKTARSLGLPIIPPSVLARADEVIE
jgi:putative ABC transport system substrate-binding protein